MLNIHKKASILLCLLLLGLSACEQGIETVNPATPDSRITLTTRSGNDDNQVSYPVSVYLFDSDSRCLELRTLQSSDESLTYNLASGSYSFYAIGGADADVYDLPAAANASSSSEICLKDGQVHGDLMTAHCDVALSADDDNTLALTMQRKVLMVQSVRLEKIPSDATAVSVTLSKSHKGITMDGTLKSVSIEELALTKSATENGVWTLAAPRMLLLTSTGATIKVSMTRDGVKKSYIYQLDDNKLKSNYKYDVKGTYTETQTIELTGTIQGAAWAGTETITFDFDESNIDGGTTGGDNTGDDSGNTGSGSDDSNITEGTAPAEGSLYKERYFVLSSKDNGSTISVLLLHDDEKQLPCTKESNEDEVASMVATTMESLSAASDINGWRLPKTDETSIFYDNIQGIKGLSVPVSERGYYVHDSEGKIRFFAPFSKGINNREIKSLSGTIHLRPVVTLTFAKQ